MQSYKRLKGEKLLMANDYNDKVSRVLSLYQRLMEGEVVDKEVEAAPDMAYLPGQSSVI